MALETPVLGQAQCDTGVPMRDVQTLSPLSPRLKEEAKKAIEALGSKEIRNMRFRSSWVFFTAKGFELPAAIQREKVSGCCGSFEV